MTSTHSRPTAVLEMLEAAASAIVGLDEHGVVDFVNSHGARLYGYAPEEMLGLRADVLLPASDAVRHGTPTGHLTGRVGWIRELDAHRKDGTVVPVDVRITELHTELGPWYVVAAVDITERLAAEGRLHALNRAYLTQARLNQAIVRAGSPRELYAETCRVAVEQGEYLGAWVARTGPGWGTTTEASAGRLDDYIAGLDITTDPDDPRGNGPTAQALRDGAFYYSGDFMTDAVTGPWQQAAADFGIRASATMPLRRGGRIVAALTLWSDQPHLFDDQMRSLLRSVAENVSFALDAFDARDRLERVAAQRSQLLRRLVAAQEEERARIAADVHDDSVQALAAMDLRLGLLRRRVRDADPELEQAVAQLQEMAGSVTSGLRHLLFDLEPVPAGAHLPDLLRDAASHAFESGTVRWAIETADADGAELPDEVVTQALRIAQEAFTNVRKHARASHVRVLVTTAPDGVEVAIADDGIGLPPDQGQRRAGHRGLATMQDRAEIVGGWCRVEPGRPGTTVRFHVPRRAPGLVGP